MASPPSQQASCALTGFVSLLEIARAKARAPPDFSTGHIHEQIVTERGLQRCPGIAVGQDQAAAEQADEQRQDDVLGQKGQGHREDRGNQGPDTEVNIHVIVSPFDIGLQPAAAGVSCLLHAVCREPAVALF